MASPTQWTWIWANWGRWRRTGKPGTLHSLRSQRDGLDRATEQQLSSASSLLGFCLGINISLVISVNKGCSRKRLLSTAVPPNSVPWGEFKERKTGQWPEGVKMHIINMTSLSPDSYHFSQRKAWKGTSLAVLWLRIHWSAPGIQAGSLSRKTPQIVEQLSPSTMTTEHPARAWGPWPLVPTPRSHSLRWEMPPKGEVNAFPLESTPACRNQKRLHSARKTQHSQK